jgi:hypothetical protein
VRPNKLGKSLFEQTGIVDLGSSNLEVTQKLHQESAGGVFCRINPEVKQSKYLVIVVWVPHYTLRNLFAASDWLSPSFIFL